MKIPDLKIREKFRHYLLLIKDLLKIAYFSLYEKFLSSKDKIFRIYNERRVLIGEILFFVLITLYFGLIMVESGRTQSTHIRFNDEAQNMSSVESFVKFEFRKDLGYVFLPEFDNFHSFSDTQLSILLISNLESNRSRYSFEIDKDIGESKVNASNPTIGYIDGCKAEFEGNKIFLIPNGSVGSQCNIGVTYELEPDFEPRGTFWYSLNEKGVYEIKELSLLTNPFAFSCSTPCASLESPDNGRVKTEVNDGLVGVKKDLDVSSNRDNIMIDASFQPGRARELKRDIYIVLYSLFVSLTLGESLRRKFRED